LLILSSTRLGASIKTKEEVLKVKQIKTLAFKVGTKSATFSLKLEALKRMMSTRVTMISEQVGVTLGAIDL
jgi:hypothetical protein